MIPVDSGKWVKLPDDSYFSAHLPTCVKAKEPHEIDEFAERKAEKNPAKEENLNAQANNVHDQKGKKDNDKQNSSANSVAVSISNCLCSLHSMVRDK